MEKILWRFDSIWRVSHRGRYVLAILFLFGAGALQCRAQGCNGVPPSTTGSVTWSPQWCQEFNATTPGPPDTTVWAFDLGNGGFGNNEIETYCGPPGYSENPSNCPTTFATSTSNAYVDGNGHLIIQAINNSGTWFSGRLKTQGLANFKFGRIEASIELPDTTNQGLWPAFWSLGSDINTTPWPACGETDMMEVWSSSVLNGPGPGGNRSTLHTAATGGSGLQPNGVFNFPVGQANDTAFHTYGMIWSANMQQFYIDNPDQPYYIATTGDLASGDSWPFNAQLFLVTNIAVGGTLGGTPSSSTPNPAIMTFDYVRQYQAVAVPAPVMGTPPSIAVKAGATTGNSSTFTPSLTAATGYVYFGCSTNAPKASCAISTNDPLNTHVMNSSALTPESVTVTVTTTANTGMRNVTSPISFSDPRFNWLPLTIGAFFLLSVLLSAGRVRRVAPKYSGVLLAGLILIGAATPSCGGGGGGRQITPPPNNGTPPGSYTVTVYAFTESNTGNGANSSADSNVAIPLTVN
jgi:beta-glucanase (GH16 family)